MHSVREGRTERERERRRRRGEGESVTHGKNTMQKERTKKIKRGNTAQRKEDKKDACLTSTYGS